MFHRILLLLLYYLEPVSPPNAKAAVCIPVPAKLSLTVFKLPGDVAQDVPLYSSVAPILTVVRPPNANPAVCVPAPDKISSCCI
jgi:hypothetical protein